MNGGPAMISLIFKSTNPAKRIGVSNIKDEIEKAALYKFGYNIKIFLITCILIAPSLLIRYNSTRIIPDIYSGIYCQGHNEPSIVSLK